MNIISMGLAARNYNNFLTYLQPLWRIQTDRKSLNAFNNRTFSFAIIIIYRLFSMSYLD